MKNIVSLLIFLISVFAFSQGSINYGIIDTKIKAIPDEDVNSIESIASYINANFKTENDKIRAVFFWTASNISYDVANMFAVNLEETPQDRIIKTLKTKKGICGDYAIIFNEIAKLVGVKSFVVRGYTKQNGKVDVLSHAWCAAIIDNKWFLFDPTWGSGFVTNNKFIRKLNNSYFKVLPDQMIKSHMPFDYLWEFLEYPITNSEFVAGIKSVDKTKKRFDFNAEILKYESLIKLDQFFESAQRIEKNGIINDLISKAYNYEKTYWNNERENVNNDKYNTIVSEYNEAINEMNDFIYYRNNKFKPLLPDDEIKSKIQIPYEKFKKCQDSLFKLGPLSSNNAESISNLKKSVASAIFQSQTHLDFVTSYLSKSKFVRKTMFSKITWFGIPLN
jgi:transglutaminase/protease-like cytokinesis protein 3